MDFKFEPTQVPQTEAQAIFYAWAKGEITQDQAAEHNAMLTAVTLHDHRPYPYPEPSPRLRSYIQGRANNVEDRDHELAIKNGEWIQVILKARTRNFKDHEHLMWAGRICKSLGAEGHASKLREAVMEHVRNHDHTYPELLFQDALIVQRLDSERRQYGDKK